MSDAARALDAVWRVEGPRTVAVIARMVGDIGLAEDLVQDAMTEALTSWPREGTPRNPGAWLTAVAKRRAIDGWRRRERLDERYRGIARDLAETHDDEWQPIEDDLLRLVFVSCHPVLSRQAQVAMTLRVVGGLASDEIARLFFVPVSTMQQRIVRAKQTLSAARVPFEVPDPSEWRERLAGVTAVVSLVFTEGYAATSGDRWIRRDLAAEALRLGRALSALIPTEPEVLGLLALMELQSSRFAARTDRDGSPILLEDQDRRRWDREAIRRGREALARADARAEVLGRARGPFALQAAIAQCHAVAPDVVATDWDRIVVLYDALGRIAPSPVVELNRAAAIAMASGPADGLALVERLAEANALPGSHLVPSVRAELLVRLGRHDEAREQFDAALALVRNDRERDVLQAKRDRLDSGA